MDTDYHESKARVKEHTDRLFSKALEEAGGDMHKLITHESWVIRACLLNRTKCKSILIKLCDDPDKDIARGANNKFHHPDLYPPYHSKK